MSNYPWLYACHNVGLEQIHFLLSFEVLANCVLGNTTGTKMTILL